MPLNIYVYVLLIFFIVQILCLRDETFIVLMYGLNLKSILGLSRLALLYRIGSCRNEETIDNENAFKLKKKHHDIPTLYSLLKLVNYKF
jgi:hypothetical protein